jgi:hypothetical protein
MPSPPTSHPANLDIAACIQAQEARIAELEAALWDGGLNESILADYQAAFRELEGLLGTGPEGDRRHHFVIVIPVADSPKQLYACLDSLLTLCRSYGYGGMRQGRFRKVSVLLADDSADSGCIEHNREIARTFTQAGIQTDYFGIDEQLALMQRLHALDLAAIVGVHPQNAFGHKGQAMMRNIAYLKLAEMRSQMSGERFLFYTVDADQQFLVTVATAQGARSLYAVNHLYHLDRIFDRTEARVVTGKVVGDPPVSPAVMAANFLEDVISFVREMAACDPNQPYRQPVADTRGSGEAAYHDMAEMFGFRAGAEAYRYRCKLDGTSDNGSCFVEFSERLGRFFHGEHPTRITWYRYQNVDESVQSARTVYTGNYVFNGDALEWFIPFAPLRLRMSGPTMGRLLKSAMGDRFVSANVPMLHRRTLEATGQSEFRPGVISQQQAVALCDEFERQFFGDVMLFSIERLAVQGLPARQWPKRLVAETLDRVYSDMRNRYRNRQGLILDRVDQLKTLLHDDERWWNHSALHTAALGRFEAFVENLERNFGEGSPCRARIDSAADWAAWRERQLAAIIGLHTDRQTWLHALDVLSESGQK